MSSYPKWLYHPTKEARVVASQAAHEALGQGWFESPADFPTVQDLPTPSVEAVPAPASAPASTPKPKKAAK